MVYSFKTQPLNNFPFMEASFHNLTPGFSTANLVITVYIKGLRAAYS